MNTISFTLNETDYAMLQRYAAAKQMSLTAIIREALFDRLEEDSALDEQRILAARERAGREPCYDHTEVWKELGI